MSWPRLSELIQKVRQPRSLRTLFIGLFLLQVLPMVSIVIGLGNQSREDTIHELAEIITVETSERVATIINQDLKTAHRINQINRDILATTTNKADYTNLLRALTIQLQNFPNLAAVAVSQVGGYTIRLNRFSTPQSEFQLELIDPQRPNELQISRVNLAGQKISDLNPIKPFTLADWPWYQTFLKHPNHSWSSPYVSRNGFSLVLSHYDQIHNPNTNSLETILVSTLDFARINQLLQNQTFQSNAIILITEPDGSLIGSSTAEPPLDFKSSQPGQPISLHRRRLQDSTNPLFIALYPRLVQAKTLKPGEHQLLTEFVNGQVYYVEFERLLTNSSLDWILITVIPEAEFSQLSQGKLMTTLAISFWLIVFLILVNLMLAQAIIRPIKTLQKQTQNLIQAHPQAQPSPIKELQDLNQAFGEMTECIQNTLSQLQITNQELQDQQDHLAQILDALPVGVAIHEKSGQLSYLNPTGAELLGLETIPDFHGADTLNQDFSLYQAGTDQLYPLEKLPAIQALQGRVVEIDDIELRKDEVRRICKVRSTALRNASGDITAALVAFVDITDRKQVEKILENYNAALSQEVAARTQALQKSEERFRFALQSTDTSWWDWDVKTNDVEWSDTFDVMVGRPPNSYPKNAASFLSFLHPDDVESTRRKLFDSVANGTPYKTEFRFVRPDGSIRWIMATGTVQRDENGQALRMSGINLDITERKKVEQDLHINEAKLRAALESQIIAWWDFDLVTNVIDCADTYAVMVGVEPNALDKSLLGFFSYLHPDDHELVTEALRLSLEHNAPYRIEFRFLRPDSTICWVLSIGSIQHNSQGEPIRMSGVVIDITERKHIEEALQKSEERLRLALSSTGTSWFDWDVVNNSIQWSDNFYAMVGRKPEDCPPSIETFISLLHPDDRKRVDRAIQASLEQDAPYRVEFRFLHPDGTIYWVMAKGIVQRDQTGSPDSLYSTLQVSNIQA